RDGWICGICGWFIIPSISVYDAKFGDWAGVIDHVIPKVAGGSNDDENLQITHYICNALKRTQVGQQTYAEWRRSQPPIRDMRGRRPARAASAPILLQPKPLPVKPQKRKAPRRKLSSKYAGRRPRTEAEWAEWHGEQRFSSW